MWFTLPPQTGMGQLITFIPPGFAYRPEDFASITDFLEALRGYRELNAKLVEQAVRELVEGAVRDQGKA